MARRIAIAILITVWTILIVGGLSSYWLTRSLLVSDLDASLLRRIATLTEAGGQGATETLPGDRYIVENQQGRTVARTEAARELPKITVENARFATLGDGRRVRTLSVLVHDSVNAQGAQIRGGTRIIYSGSADGIDRALASLAWALVICGAASGAAAALVAVYAARHALKPLLQTATVIGEIDEHQLDRRIEGSALPSELQPVAERLNAMLQRLEQAFEQRRRFLADASHELRTPVAALMTTLEVALRRPRDEAELRNICRRCLADARLMRRLVEALMEQVRGEAGVSNDAEQTVAVDQLLRDCVDAVTPLADERDVSVECDLPDVQMRTQPVRVQSMVMNLLSNAIEYNRPGGQVWLRCEVGDAQIVIEVSDTGQGISETHLSRVFEPFYRADAARKRNGEHLGLGLALVQTHISALKGRCSMKSTLGEGTTVALVLPGEIVPALVASGEVP